MGFIEINSNNNLHGFLVCNVLHASSALAILQLSLLKVAFRLGFADNMSAGH